MDAIDVAAIVAIVLCLAAAALFAVIARRMVRALRDIDALAESLRVEAVPLVSDLRATVRQAGDDLDRVEAVLGKAETIATTVDAASRLTYRALRPPLVKTMAFMSGAGRATRRLRGGRPAVGSGRTIDARAIEAKPGDGARREPKNRASGSRRRGRRRDSRR
ncbi:MAG: hypothetical protein ABI658_11240 [Acidimicrobiales bacterium]